MFTNWNQPFECRGKHRGEIFNFLDLIYLYSLFRVHLHLCIIKRVRGIWQRCGAADDLPEVWQCTPFYEPEMGMPSLAVGSEKGTRWHPLLTISQASLHVKVPCKHSCRVAELDKIYLHLWQLTIWSDTNVSLHFICFLTAKMLFFVHKLKALLLNIGTPSHKLKWTV